MSSYDYVNPWMLERIHARRNWEKACAQLHGALTVFAGKDYINAQDLRALREKVAFFEESDHDLPRGMRDLIIELAKCDEDLAARIPEFARNSPALMAALAEVSVTQPDDWTTSSIKGVMDAVLADGIVDDTEASLITDLQGMEVSPLAISLLQGTSLTQQATEGVTIKGSTIVLTGNFRIPRRKLADQLTASGAKVTGSVSRRTTYVVVSDYGSDHWSTAAGGTKIQRALDLGIPIIDEDTIMSALG